MTGPYCSVCAEQDGNYYHSADRACKDCASAGVSALGIILLVALPLLLLAALLGRRRRTGVLLPARANEMATRALQLGLKNKLKLIFSMYQVTTKVPEVYIVQMPSLVQNILRVFRVPLDLGFDSFATQSLNCMNLTSFGLVLFVFMLVPLLLLLAAVAVALVAVRLASTPTA